MIDARFGVDQVHRIRFTIDALDPGNPVLREAIAADGATAPRRAIAFIDAGVAAADGGVGDRLVAYAAAHRDRIDLVAAPEIVTGGEAAKSDWSVYERVLAAIERHRICRQSFVVAIGGGAMLDAVGFAAATAHRGVRLVRLPTTTLGQDDAGIGVKNGINAFGKKNFIGAFGVPWAVINDSRFLETLSDADWRAGISEAVKVALLKDVAFYEAIAEAAPQLRRRDEAALIPIVRRSAELHLAHIAEGGDPFEMLAARPLDFGHWAAHRLESMTDHRLRHGEAVAIGIALDCVYAARTGLLAETACAAILDVLEAIGLPIWDEAMADAAALLKGLEEFREHLGGAMTITMLRAPGDPLDLHEIDRAAMAAAIEALRDRAARGAGGSP